MMIIYNSPRKDVQNIINKNNIQNIISIYSPNDRFEIFLNSNNLNFIRLCFNDINSPRDNLKLITQRDINKIIKFAEKLNQNAQVMCHCFAGVSRSIAITMVLCFLSNKDWTPMELSSVIKEKAPYANPNKLVLTQAGRVLKKEKYFDDLANLFKNPKRVSTGAAFSIEC